MNYHERVACLLPIPEQENAEHIPRVAANCTLHLAYRPTLLRRLLQQHRKPGTLPGDIASASKSMEPKKPNIRSRFVSSR